MDNLSFEQAIEQSQAWLDQVVQGDVPNDRIPTDLVTLLSTVNGVRGFFVTFLSGDCPLADEIPPPFQAGFTQAIDRISEIVIKNLAMSTAMILTHDRQGDEALKAGSQTVQRRSLQLVSLLLELTPLQRERDELLNSLKTETGTYQAFLDRWGYDGAQRQAIQGILERTV